MNGEEHKEEPRDEQPSRSFMKNRTLASFFGMAGALGNPALEQPAGPPRQIGPTLAEREAVHAKKRAERAAREEAKILKADEKRKKQEARRASDGPIPPDPGVQEAGSPDRQG